MTALPTVYTVTGCRVHCGECGYDLSGLRYQSDGIYITVTCPICGSDWGPDELHFDTRETDSSHAWEQVERLTAERDEAQARLTESRRQVEALLQQLADERAAAVGEVQHA